MIDNIMAIPKPVKKMTTSKLKAKCDILASLFYRKETPYCELQGKDGISCSQQLQWMHIFTRSILHIRYEPYNKLIGCSGHHSYYTYHPIEWVRFLEQHFPDRLHQAEARRYDYAKVDYEYWINKFKE